MFGRRVSFRLAALLAVTLLLSASLVACDDDDGGGGNGGTTTETSGDTGYPETTTTDESSEPAPDRTSEAVCKIGAKAIELIGAGLRQGSTVRHIIETAGPGLENGCQIAYEVVETLLNRPDEALKVTIVGPTDSELTQRLNGIILRQQAPANPSADARNCSNYTTKLMYQLCIRAKLEALANPAVQ